MNEILNSGAINKIIEISKSLLKNEKPNNEIKKLLEEVKNNVNLTISKMVIDNIEYQKNIHRRGWIIRGIPNSENNLQHSLSLSLICEYFKEFLINSGYDYNKLILMCLIHDIAENNKNVGDIIPGDGIPEKTKQELEKASALGIFETIDQDSFFYGIWSDYTFKRTKEAIFLKELDKIDPLIKCIIYEEEYNIPLFMEFYNYMVAKNQIKDPFLLEFRSKLLERYLGQK